MYRFCSKLGRLSNSEKGTGISPFSVNYKCVMFYSSVLATVANIINFLRP